MDLRHVRRTLGEFIESDLGFEAVLSERGDVAYEYGKELDESCYIEVQSADLFLLILGRRYGSKSSLQTQNPPKGGPDGGPSDSATGEYKSITETEFDYAAGSKKPVIIILDRGVSHDHETWLANGKRSDLVYPSTDSIRTLEFVDRLRSSHPAPPIFAFENLLDAREWLRAQWAGVFQRLLSRDSLRRESDRLSIQIEKIEQINITLKAYMEAMMKTLKSDDLTEQQNERLTRQTVKAVGRENAFVSYCIENLGVDELQIFGCFREGDTLPKFLDLIEPDVVTMSREDFRKLADGLAAAEVVKRDFEAARREILGSF